MTYSYTNNYTFTITHARYLASKVATDLKRIQRLYGAPSDDDILAYEEELSILLKNNVMEDVTYGFQRNGKFIEPSLVFTSQDLNGLTGIDDDPGRIKPGKDIEGAHFTSFLTYNNRWSRLPPSEKEKIKDSLPINRTTGDRPGINGYLSNDKSYSSGGRQLNRSTIKSL